jgi:hypothetical protein
MLQWLQKVLRMFITLLAAPVAVMYSFPQEHELWLQPSSMDAKAGFSSSANTRAGLSGKVPKADVVLTTYEVVCAGGCVAAHSCCAEPVATCPSLFQYTHMCAL